MSLPTTSTVFSSPRPTIVTQTGGGHPLGGTNILFEMFDTSAAGSDNVCHDVDGTNVLFTLIDNVRITNFPNVVTVAATQPNASEIGPASGTFTITRTASGTPLTVYYSLSGTATNGIEYQTLPGSVILPRWTPQSRSRSRRLTMASQACHER